MKKLAVVVTICSALVLLRSIAFAAAFGDKTLKGHYVLHVTGFDLNDVTAGVGHQGEFAILGLLNFNGKGGISVLSLNVAGADTGGDQAVCSPTLSSASYSVSGGGTGTLTLDFGSSLPTAGTLTFNIVLGGSNGHHARLLLSNSGFSGASAVTLCGEPISTLVLQGEIELRGIED